MWATVSRILILDEVGQGCRPSGSCFLSDSVLGSLGLARLGDVTEMVQTPWYLADASYLSKAEIFSRASYLNTSSFSVEPRWHKHVYCLSLF